jgi:phenylalanyl-tRNA synthetase beta chain
MKFPISLLEKTIDFKEKYTPDQISQYLTSVGIEVESVVNLGDAYKNFIIGQILECEKHPESAKLNLCKVNIGDETLDIVCGAKNPRKGLKVVVAKFGAIVPKNKMEIKKTSIKGVESNGMICSIEELMIDKTKYYQPEDGIVEIPENALVGTNFAEYANLNEIIFSVSITPNRGDACSILGLSRDLCAKGLGTLKNLFNLVPINSQSFSRKVQNEEELSNVNFAYIKNTDLSQSILEDLKIFGITWGSSTILLVDLINYVMFLTGVPMHIYDASKIKGGIVIRRSKEGETLIPIKGEMQKLPEGLLVIADDEKILSLAGVMGDARSKVTAETSEFIVECVHFKPEDIIKSSGRTGIKSDSSYRFERGVDSSKQEDVLRLTLFQMGVKSAELFNFSSPPKESEIEYKMQDYTDRIGFNISKETAFKILKSLDFKVEERGDKIIVKIPPFRSDISSKEGITSEIARINGYENISSKPIQDFKYVKNKDSLFELKKVLSSELQEIVSYSFFKEEFFGMFTSNVRPVRPLNPINSDLSVMRDSLIPNLLLNISEGQTKNETYHAIFEVGTIFEDCTPEGQKTNFAAAFAGIKTEKNFLQSEEEFNIWHAKNKMLEVLLNVYGVRESSISFSLLEGKHVHTKQAFNVLIGKNTVGILAAIHQVTLDEMNIKGKVFVFELFTSKLPIKKPKSKTYKAKILHDIEREIAIIVKKDIKFEVINNVIKKLRIPSLSEIKVIDIFEDSSRIGKDLKSVSLRFKISQDDTTLTKEQIDGEIIRLITKTLANEFGAKLRDGETAK